MLKKLKRLLLFIAFAVLLALAAGVALLSSLDPNQFKPQLQQQLRQHSGLELRLPGELDWQLLPTLAITVGQGELHSPEDFDGDSLLAGFQQIELGLSWRALLARRVEFTALAIDSLQLRLVTDARGQQNWQFQESTKNNDADQGADNSNKSGDTETAALPPLVFHSLDIRNSEFRIIDLASKSRQTVLLRELQASELNAQGDAFPLSVELAIDTGDEQPLSVALSASATLDLPDHRVALDELQLVADQSKASGRIDAHYAPSLQLVTDLRIDQLDLDRYFVASADATSSNTSSAPDSAGTEPQELPLEWLDLLQGEMALRIDQLVANQIALTNVSLQASLADRQLRIDTLAANAFGGAMQFSGTLDNRKTPAQLDFQQDLDAIQIEQLLASVDSPVNLSGRATMASRLTASGNQWQQWLQTLQGQTNLELQEAQFADDNLDRRACQAIALIRNETLGPNWPTDTKLAEVSTVIRWQQGIANIEQLVAATPVFRLAGNGYYRLLDNHYDLRIGATLAPGDEAALAAMDPACVINQRYRDIAWPLRCRGDLDNRDCGVDNSRLDKLIKRRLADEASEKLEEKVQSEVEDKLKEKLGDELGESVGGALKDALEGLFR